MEDIQIINLLNNLPDLNYKHETYPLLLPCDNTLFCFGGICHNDDNLGHIELLDYRDNKNQWIYIDSVEHYFNLPNHRGDGFNCFLSLSNCTKII